MWINNKLVSGVASELRVKFCANTFVLSPVVVSSTDHYNAVRLLQSYVYASAVSYFTFILSL